MTKDEYKAVLREIISDERGFDAIRDLAKMIYHANMLAVMKELETEQNRKRSDEEKSNIPFADMG